MLPDGSNDVIIPMNLTRSKRDEFLIDIRKKKNQNFLHQKRIRMSQGIVRQPQSNMQVEGLNPPVSYFEVQSQQQTRKAISAEMENKLKVIQDQFYEVLPTQLWDDLIPLITFLRKCVADQSDGLSGKYVIEMGIVPHLLSLLSEQFYSHEQLQFEIMWLLANLAAGDTEDCDYLVEQNIIPILSGIFKESKLVRLHENIMWTLANICGESNLNHRDKILQMGVLDQVVRQLSTNPKPHEYLMTAAWLISNLVRGSPFPAFDKVSKCFGALTHLMNEEHDGVKRNSLLSLSYLSQDPKEANLKGIADFDLIKKVVASINHNNSEIAMYALRIVGNLAKGNKRVMNNLYEHDVFKAIPSALRSPDRDLRKEACNTLELIFSDEFDDQDYVLDFDIIPALVKLAGQDETEIRILATMCLANFLVKASLEDATFVAKSNAFEILFQNLASNEARLVEYSLITIHKLLEHGASQEMRQKNNGNNPWQIKIVENGWVPVIENLQYFPAPNVYEKMAQLLENFF